MDQLTKLLESLAIKLGTTTEYLWGVLIRQSHIVIIYDSILLVLLIAFFAMTKKIHDTLKKGHDKRKEDAGYMDFNGWLLALLAYWGFWIVMVFVATDLIGELITVSANPEFWALKQIFSQLK